MQGQAPNVGFALLREIAAGLKIGEHHFADANQAWDVEEAERFLRQVQDPTHGWLEEPIRTDAPDNHWPRLAALDSVTLAAGENMARESEFEWAAHPGVFGVLQPDLGKWGGVSGCLDAARTILRHDLRYCPHRLGGGIGLTASAHLLAAAGGDGVLEVDVNPNPWIIRSRRRR